jgi:soluble lytic murein transglycosylase-like protein
MRLQALAPVAAAVMAAAVVLTWPSAAAAVFSHVVAPGESLSSVAAADGLSVKALAAANGLSPQAALIAGSSVVIPPQTMVAAPQTTAAGQTNAGEASAGSGDGDGDTDDGVAEGEEGRIVTATMQTASSSGGGSFVVQPGETLSEIAARAGMSVEALAALNGIDPSAPLLSGVVLRLSEGSSERPAVAGQGQEGPSEHSAVAGQGQSAAAVAGGEAPLPTEETVSPSEVGQVASEHGVPPSFAEAIAEQESGFNNGLTSSANARGVMQIVPGTWSWINQNLAPMPPLAPASAASNVRGGVLLLQRLLGESGGDPALAAAGYYQGLESVRREGEAPETEQYVNSVLALQNRFAGE